MINTDQSTADKSEKLWQVSRGKSQGQQTLSHRTQEVSRVDSGEDIQSQRSIWIMRVQHSEKAGLGSGWKANPQVRVEIRSCGDQAGLQRQWWLGSGQELSTGVEIQVKGFHDDTGQGCGRAGDQHSYVTADAGASSLGLN